MARAAQQLAPYDAMLLPTVACEPPTIAECESSAERYAEYYSVRSATKRAVLR